MNDDTTSRVVKLIAVCLLCIGIVTALVLLFT